MTLHLLSSSSSTSPSSKLHLNELVAQRVEGPAGQFFAVDTGAAEGQHLGRVGVVVAAAAALDAVGLAACSARCRKWPNSVPFNTMG
jgi:hypothetical protein